MNNVQLTLLNIHQMFRYHLKHSGEELIDNNAAEFNSPGWSNKSWTSDIYRKAHINVIDALDSRGLWMMHCCIYPHYHNPAPIFGFDVFAGKNKITGCFHDFSPVVSEHSLSSWFKETSVQLEWNKKRELPDWGKRIFSESIIAAGNVQSDIELEQIENMIVSSINVYLSSLKDTNNTVDDVSNKHFYYIENQRLNPHNPRVLMTLGLSEEQANEYVSRCLFPNN